MQLSRYTTPPESNKDDGWETVGKIGRGKKVSPKNQQEAGAGAGAGAGWNSVGSGGRSSGRCDMHIYLHA